MTNQVTEDVRFYRNDWINVGLQSVWFSLFLFYFLDLSFCRSVKKCPFPQVELSKLDGDDESVASHRIRAGSITNDSFITAFFEDPFRSYLKLVYLLEPYNG